jgi:outer membrane protein insertion porin family
VDEDLLNEGNRRLRDYYQRLGYFDAKVDHHPNRRRQRSTFFSPSSWGRAAAWRRSPSRRKPLFFHATLMELLSVHAADVLDRHGIYSQALVSADVSALRRVYQNNGFSKVKVTRNQHAGDRGG